MLKAIHIENFKAFGEKVEIPLAPITLILGENSAGKSSVLQALSLLKQTQENPQAWTPLLFRVDRGYTELGSFSEAVHGHDTGKQMYFQLDVVPEDDQEVFKNQYGVIGVGLWVRWNDQAGQIEHAGNRICTGLIEADALNENGEIKIPLAEDAKEKRYQWFVEHKKTIVRFLESEDGGDALLQMMGPSYDPSSEVSYEADGKKYNMWNDEITPQMEADGEKENNALREKLDRYSDELNQRQKEALAFYSSDFSRKQLDGRLGEFEIASYEKEGAGTSLFPFKFSIPQYPNDILFDGGRAFDGIHMGDRRHREILADYPRSGAFGISCLDKAGVSFFKAIGGLCPLGPYRQAPERLYMRTGRVPQGVGYHGEFLPEYLLMNPKLQDDINVWLGKFETGYKLSIESVGAKDRGFFEMALLDQRRKGIRVGIADVGFGVSQILPLVAQSVSSKNQTITVEQPEVHIHPRLQAEIGGLVAASYKENGNQFIIETHSEHLVLRMQKLIRKKALKPEDVSILYISRGESGSTVQQLRLDEDGEFIDSWPGGFFPERINEITGD
jgi:hypothetical protein